MSSTRASTDWAVGLNPEHLHLVIWLIGEIRGRGMFMLRVLKNCLSPFHGVHEAQPAFEEYCRLFRGVPDLEQCYDSRLPVIPDQVREEFAIEKHCQWAMTLRDAELHPLLATIGGLEQGWDSLETILNDHFSRSRPGYEVFRARFAVMSLMSLVRGERMTIDEYCGRLADAQRAFKDSAAT